VQPTLPEPPWLAWLSGTNKVLVQTGNTIAILLAGVFLGQKTYLAGVLCVFISLVCFLLDFLREGRNRKLIQQKEQQNEHQLESMLITLTDVGQSISSALMIADKRLRDRAVGLVRGAMLEMVHQRIGPPKGVRVNLFTVVDIDQPRMEALSVAHAGRVDHKSTRVFTMADESMKIAVENNQGRFVRNVAEINEQVPYGTFAVMPVSTENKLFGIITVDAPKPGDITQFEASVVLNLFAALFTLTFVRDQEALSLAIHG